MHFPSLRSICLTITDLPDLADRNSLALARARARRAAEGALFLHEIAAAEIEERLGEVNKSFNDVALVTGHPEFWSARYPRATVVADDDLLPLAVGAFDLVIHAMALHWSSDPVGQMVQARRALRPDGLFLGATFGDQTLTELRVALAEAEVAVTGGLSPRVAPMAEIRDLGALLQRAGLALPVADSLRQTVTYANPLGLIADLRAMGETNVLAQRDRRTPPRALFAEAMRLYSSHFAGADGRVPATFDLIFLTGWAPAENQPKPLRPGSAITRLADVLGTTETPAGDTTAPPKD